MRKWANFDESIINVRLIFMLLQARTRLLRPPRLSRRASGRRVASPALASSSTGLRLLFAAETPRSLASGMFTGEHLRNWELMRWLLAKKMERRRGEKCLHSRIEEGSNFKAACE